MTAYLQVTNDLRARVVVESIQRVSDDFWSADWHICSGMDEIFAAGNSTFTGNDYGGLIFRSAITDDLTPETRATLCDALWLAWLRAHRQQHWHNAESINAKRRQRSVEYAV